MIASLSSPPHSFEIILSTIVLDAAQEKKNPREGRKKATHKCFTKKEKPKSAEHKYPSQSVLI